MNMHGMEGALRELRLSRIAATLSTRMTQAQSTQEPFLDTFAAMPHDELDRRRSRLTERRFKQSPLDGVIPVSRTKPWLDTFAEIERLAPGRIVPGRGHVTDLKTAQAQTRDYLLALRAHMTKAVDDGQDMIAAVKSFDGRSWLPLLNAAELMPGNASRTYLELERE